MITTAFVKIWDTLVGAVVWDQDKQLASFEYDESFINNGWELAPLKLPLNSNKKIFSFPELRTKDTEFNTFKGLPGLLADVLPDKYGNQLINAWLAQNGRPANSMNPVETLCFIGQRGMGALEFEPTQFLTQPQVFDVEIDGLIEAATTMLKSRSNFQTSFAVNELQAMRDILKIGTSAGGARPKAVIAYNEKTKEIKSGQGITPEGFEQWLIKLDGVSDAQFGSSSGYGRVEMAYYEMARACGIDMMDSMLLEENGRAHFMTRRFDREHNESKNAHTKHHVQTFCAMEHFDFNLVTSFSYEQLFQTMRKLRLPYPQAEQMFKRMVFNVASRNCDDHTKNFAFTLKKGQNWELSKAYDICHAYRPDSMWVSQHALSVNGKRKNITKEDLIIVAESMNIKKASSIITEISEIIQTWPTFAEAQKVERTLAKTIQNTLVDLSVNL